MKTTSIINQIYFVEENAYREGFKAGIKIMLEGVADNFIGNID